MAGPLAESHEEQATDAERRGDTEQAMGWFADSMRLRDVIHVVSSIEIPFPLRLTHPGAMMGLNPKGKRCPKSPASALIASVFYREHDRLIRENPTLRQQQELNWAALQSFRTLAGRVMEELQKQQEAARPGR